MEKIKLYLPSIIFNIAEVLIIVLIGILLELPLAHITLIFVVFAIIRMSLKGSMHYKDWYKCLVWSTLVFLSLFVVAKAGMVVSLIMTIFCAYILTTKGNINDIFLWNKVSKYSDIDEYIKYNAYEDKLLEFENKIKEQNNLDYLIYKYRFKENLTFEEISTKLDIHTSRISEKIERIAFALRLYCGI